MGITEPETVRHIEWQEMSERKLINLPKVLPMSITVGMALKSLAMV